jgi:voltage-dependent anion channel protein 2
MASTMKSSSQLIHHQTISSYAKPKSIKQSKVSDQFLQLIVLKKLEFINKINMYTYDHKFVIATTTQSGLAFTSNAVKRGDAFLGDIITSFKNKNITADVKVDSKSNIITTITVDEFAPGAKSIFSFTIPDHNSGKLELQYHQDFAAITGSIGLTASPVVEATGVVGSDGFSVGGELGFDTVSGKFTKYNAGVNYIKPDFNASVIL